MNDAQLFTAIGVPTFAVLLAWLSNRADLHRLADRSDARIDRLETNMRGEITGLRAEMVILRNQIHADMVQLHERVAVVETKQTSSGPEN